MPRKHSRASRCPFTVQKISHPKDLVKLNYYKLKFNNLLLDSPQSQKYSFRDRARNKSGVFVFRERDTNQMIASGTSTTDLYDQIRNKVLSFKIGDDAILAVIYTPPELAAKTLQCIKESYKARPVDSLYDVMIASFKQNQPFPTEAIRFVPFFSTRKSIEHTTRMKTSVAYLRSRVGVYFIRERKKESNDEFEIVYIGKATFCLNRRIYAHFSVSRQHCDRSYVHKLHSHEYEVGAIEFPRGDLNQDELKDHIFDYEQKLIKQIDPRDNKMFKIVSKKDEWFDEGFPEVENEFATVKKIRI